MHKVNPRIHEIIAAKVLADNEERTPSGRLSASRLGWPLQWQMLWKYKIPQKPVDEHTLRKFQRGKDVEERVMKWLAPRENQMQVPVTYRGVVGFADVVLDHPIEVKSCTSRAFTYKQREGTAFGHRLQGELYALALGYETFEVAYVSADDYRVLSFEERVSGDVDTVIDEYEAQCAAGTVPVFAAKEKWHAMKDYNPYPDWMNLTQEQINEKLFAILHPGGINFGEAD